MKVVAASLLLLQLTASITSRCFFPLVAAFLPSTLNKYPSTQTRAGTIRKSPRRLQFVMGAEPSLMDVMSGACTKALGREVKLKPSSGRGGAGGGGASVSAAEDSISGEKYFIKSAPVARGGGTMLRAEYLGIKEMADTNTIRVPKPIAYGEGGPLNTAFVVFEYLNMGGTGGSGYELGADLARMHQSTSDNGFGFHVDKLRERTLTISFFSFRNYFTFLFTHYAFVFCFLPLYSMYSTIGATPQPNKFTDSWPDFWDEQRLGHMLKLTRNLGLNDKKVQELRGKTKDLLSHGPKPSLIHGDLWGGNKGYAKIDGKAVPVIFDPATYYGDREADIAMTYVFGGFGADFYEGYESVWPLPVGHEKRRIVYELYHIMNHCVLFGGGYCSQSKGMVEKILRL